MLIRDETMRQVAELVRLDVERAPKLTDDQFARLVEDMSDWLRVHQRACMSDVVDRMESFWIAAARGD